MLTVDYKARADMTEVILCLSAVYSGRPLPPRKKSSRPSKPDEKVENKKTTAPVKKETPSDARIGKFRTDSQGFRDENIYDPSKVTEGKKLASNSVAARRKRAAVSSAAASASGPPSSNPTPPSSVDPLTFSSIQGSEDETSADVAFSNFGDLNGFDSSKEDFFNAFDKSKDDHQQFRANDGFDHDAFGASGWVETPTATETATENLQKLSLNSFENDVDAAHRSKPRRKSSDSFDSFDSFEKEMHDGAHPKPRRKSNTFEVNGERTTSDGTGRRKQRRKSYGGRTQALRDAAAGFEGENAGADSDKKERRSKKEGGKNEDDRRRRSVSRSGRKPRRGSTTKQNEEKGSAGGDGKTPKANSIRSMFNRKPEDS